MIIIAITGASGVIYGAELLKALKELNIETGLMISDSAKTVIKYELEDYFENDFEKIKSLADYCFDANEISSIVGALSSARFNSADICLYVPKEDKEKLNRLKLDNYIDLPEKVNKFDTIHFEQSKLF